MKAGSNVVCDISVYLYPSMFKYWYLNIIKVNTICLNIVFVPLSVPNSHISTICVFVSVIGCLTSHVTIFQLYMMCRRIEEAELTVGLPVWSYL